MKLLVDKDLALSTELFPKEWLLVGKAGREICNADVLDADALLVRSITRVNEELLQGSKVSYVGTATAGLDHIDSAYLSAQGIKLVDAAGCNANAVTDYCLAALAYCVLERGLKPSGSTVGIVGAGHVGSLLVRKLQAMGFEVHVNDPPLQAATGTLAGNLDFCSLEEVAGCDIVSLHVPLVGTGLHPTRQLIAGDFLSRMPEKGVLINACRGEVVDESALQEHLSNSPDFTAVVDVWKGEPMVNPASIRAAHIATPHIAGYSARAKARAVQQISAGLLKHCGLSIAKFSESSDNRSTADGGQAWGQDVSLSSKLAALDDMALWQTILQHFPLQELSSEFKNRMHSEECKAVFDDMRKQLTSRQEFREIKLADSDSDSNRCLQLAIGFQD